jgi:hypothetical protein
MPVLDGFAFLGGFGAMPEGVDVAVVLMTDVRDVVRARRQIENQGPSCSCRGHSADSESETQDEASVAQRLSP